MAFVVHGMWLLIDDDDSIIGVTGGLALPSDEARLAETPLESPGLLRLQHGLAQWYVANVITIHKQVDGTQTVYNGIAIVFIGTAMSSRIQYRSWQQFVAVVVELQSS